MPIYYGNTKIKDLYYEDKKIKYAYCGNKLVYAKPITFLPSGSIQTLVIPQYVNKIHVDCVASKGGLRTTSAAGARAGYGGRVQCDLAVTGGQTLYITVGDIPSGWTTAIYNASDIRTDNTGITDTTSLQSRLVVAGGGGSGSQGRRNVHYEGNGGDGGGLIGGNGTSTSTGRGAGGKGGTQTSGGAGGSGYNAAGRNGTLGMGGAGHTSGAGSGAGGAGYYGGGSGGFGGHEGTYSAAGGGGGSSFTDENLCSNVVHTQGYNDGAGYVTISFVSE